MLRPGEFVLALAILDDQPEIRIVSINRKLDSGVAGLPIQPLLPEPLRSEDLVAEVQDVVLVAHGPEYRPPWPPRRSVNPRQRRQRAPVPLLDSEISAFRTCPSAMPPILAGARVNRAWQD